MPLLLSKRSPRQRERRELLEEIVRGGGVLFAIADERKEINECVWCVRGMVGLSPPLIDSTKRNVSRRNTTNALQKDFLVVNLFQASEISIVR